MEASRLENIVNNAEYDDQSGSVILELLLQAPRVNMPGYPNFNIHFEKEKMHELVATTAWYMEEDTLGGCATNLLVCYVNTNVGANHSKIGSSTWNS
jgi:hypothetical protein